MLRGGERLGLYFVEKGASQRGSKVIYDRANSAIAQAKREEFGLGQHSGGCGLVSLDRHHAGTCGELPEITLDALQQVP